MDKDELDYADTGQTQEHENDDRNIAYNFKIISKYYTVVYIILRRNRLSTTIMDKYLRRTLGFM